MSTIDRLESGVLSPLVPGPQLDQTTFHNRYKAMPPGTRAELIGGIVHMPSPLRHEQGEINDVVGYWLSHYLEYLVFALDPKSRALVRARQVRVLLSALA